MALGIKIIYTIRNSLPGSSLKLILNALVLNHLHYSAVVIQSMGKNLLVSIEKQINWALKAFFYWSKFESTKQLRLEHNILHIKLFIETKRLLYFWKIKSGQLPVFSPKTGQSLATWSVVQSQKLFSETVSSRAKNYKTALLVQQSRSGKPYQSQYETKNRKKTLKLS